MICLYLHGFSSAFDIENPKIKTLLTRYQLLVFNYDSTAPYNKILKSILKVIHQHNITLVVGCSLGGFYALEVSKQCAVFSVALNPTFNPKQSLKKHIGDNKNYKTGQLETLLEKTVLTYPDNVTLDGNGLVFIEKGDAVINPIDSFNFFEKSYPTTLVADGSHRFESLDAQLDYIIVEHKKFIQ